MKVLHIRYVFHLKLRLWMLAETMGLNHGIVC